MENDMGTKVDTQWYAAIIFVVNHELISNFFPGIN
jgi:hypothetical protein